MAQRQQQKRGNFADLPTLADGELGVVQDVKKVYVGNGGTNFQLQTSPSTTDYIIYVATTALGGLSQTTQGATGLLLTSGTTTSTTANKLVDTTASFTAVLTGKTVYNSTDDTWAKITAVDSATTLSLSVDIMVSGESYQIANAIDNIPEAFNTADSGFVANVTIRISPGTFSNPLTFIGKIAGGAKTLTLQGSTTTTSTIAGEVSIYQKVYLKNLMFTKRIFEYFGSDVDWTTCVTSGDDGFIITKSSSIYNTFRTTSVVVFQSDPYSYTNISSTVTIGYTLYTATSSYGGDDAVADGFLITQGTATSTTANKLVDSTANFNATDHLNKTVYNSTDDTWAKISAIDSTTQVTLSVDIMVSGESYKIVNACSTLQKTLNFIPGISNCDVGIKLSDGTFSETVVLNGKAFSGAFRITITGTKSIGVSSRAQVSAVQGSGATFGSITDSNTNPFGSSTDLMLYSSNNDEYRIVDSITAATATIVGYWTVAPTGNFTVYGWGTIINSGAGSSLSLIDQRGVTLNFLSCTASLRGIVMNNSTLTANHCKFMGSTGTVSVDVQTFSYATFNQCFMGNSSTGVGAIVYAFGYSDLFITRCKILSNGYKTLGIYMPGSSKGVFITGPSVVDMVSTASGYGIRLLGLNKWNSGSLYNKIRNCALYGLYASELSGLVFNSNNVYSGNGTNIAADATTFSYSA